MEELRSQSLKLRPCILVTESVKVDRQVEYKNRTVKMRGNMQSLNVRKKYKNKVETSEADRVYSNARYRIRRRCFYTELGYLCADTQRAALDLAVREARDLIRKTNKSFKDCQIRFRVLLSSDPANDPDAVEAVRESLVEQVLRVGAALEAFDFKRARDTMSLSKHSLELLQNCAAKRTFMEFRENAEEIGNSMAQMTKTMTPERAILSLNGRALLKRVRELMGDVQPTGN